MNWLRAILPLFIVVLLLGLGWFLVDTARSLQGHSTSAAQEAYRKGDFQGAEQILSQQLDSPVGQLDVDALVLRGLARHQLHKTALARKDFEQALKVEPKYADAWYGLALVLREQGQLQEAARKVKRAIELNSSDSDYFALQETLPPVYDPRPARPRPARLSVPFMARDGKLRLASGQAIEVKGMNMGVALPGKFASEFPDAKTFTTWIEQLAAMHVNTLRVYTILPPEFYRALLNHNRSHPDQLLYLIQGVWTELPENDDYRGRFRQQFTEEMDRALGVVHGDIDLPLRRGHASGRYDADVSPYLLAYIIGREWEPFSVVAYDKLAVGQTNYSGQFFKTQNATPMEAWFAGVMDHLASEQVRRYNTLTPIAFTNWPTLDPLYHVSEPTKEEEFKLRRARGELADDPYKKAFNEDEASLDALHIVPTAKNRAGTFASFHAYPYYPDFMNNDPKYRAHPVSNYAGYLADLKAHFGSMPIMISEIGVPSSRDIAHFQRQGRYHGRHSEAEQARIDVELDREIRAAGLAGTILFAWLDEWFKHNWLYIDLELPSEHNVRWLNVMDAEQNYGMLAAEPTSEFPLCGDQMFKLPHLRGTDAVRVLPTPAYLHLVFPTPKSGQSALNIDTHPVAGPEFRVKLGRAGGRLLINSGYRLFKPVRAGKQLYYLQDFSAVPEAGADFVPFLNMPNMRRIGRDGTVYPEQLAEPGRLTFGPPEGRRWQDQQRDATRDYCQRDGFTHLRLPWTLLGFTDPSSRRVFDGSQPDQMRQVKDIGIEVNGQGARLTWPTWQQPSYRLRTKPAYFAFQRAWAPPASSNGGDR